MPYQSSRPERHTTRDSEQKQRVFCEVRVNVDPDRGVSALRRRSTGALATPLGRRRTEHQHNVQSVAKLASEASLLCLGERY